MFKLLIVAGWLFFASDVVLVIFSVAETISPSPGADAAGRGMTSSFAGLGLVFLLICGTGLYFSGRAHSWLGAIVSIVPLLIPAVFFGATKLDSCLYNRRLTSDSAKIGRYPDPVRTELAKAIQAGDFEAMRKTLATHPHLNGRDEAGYDLLSLAVSETLGSSHADDERIIRVEGVRLLLEAGMAPNEAQDPNGDSTFAGSASHVSQTGTQTREVADQAGAEVFRLFLEHGADPNAVRSGEPLIFSVAANLDSLREILDHGADMNKRDADGVTPLLSCLWNARWDAALLLVERGADIDVSNSHGTTPETCMANGKRLTEEVFEKPLPDSYYKLKAALERRRASEPHPSERPQDPPSATP
ncbi:MAG: ankyrin repeat domain-containing protein [Bryobacteraceae bacterium]